MNHCNRSALHGIILLLTAGSLKEFGSLLEEIEGEWSKTIERSEIQLVTPLER